MRGERNEDLRRDGGDADAQRCSNERAERRRERGRHERDHRPAQRRRDQAPVLEQIAQRRDENKSGRIPELRDGHDQTRTRFAYAERAADRVEQRLRVVEIPNRETAGGSEHRDRCARHRREPGSGRPRHERLRHAVAAGVPCATHAGTIRVTGSPA